MGRADFLKLGDYNVVDDRTGFKMKRSQCRKQWNNLIVRKESWEARNQQDFIRAKPDEQKVADPRTRAAATFLAVNEVKAEDL